MRQSWNEIRSLARTFAEEWQDARYEKGETQSFYNAFFEVFGVNRRRVASFEKQVEKLSGTVGFIDLFWKGTLLVEHKSAGRDLKLAKQQAFDYFPGLKEAELPRYVLLSDFQTFELYDLDEGKEWKFPLNKFPANVEAFSFVLGVQTRTFKDQDPVNIEASELMGSLHDAIKETGYDTHGLERLLVRLVFCLFADSMGIFQPRGSFAEYVAEQSREDGRDLGALLTQLFEILDEREEKRPRNLSKELAQFPYINGDLFKERLPTPQFDRHMRDLLLEACGFDWSAVSPAIFGSLFQSVMNKAERRKAGAHYTTEQNIMKVIQPLFLDRLRTEFEALRRRRDTGRISALNAFHERLAELTFFDPACGCGNFLIIAYRELRQLELELLTEVHSGARQYSLDVASLSRINVDQFYGIEIGEFAARIAEVALWMTDHAANNKLSLDFGGNYARIPLITSPRIVNADALELDWNTLLPAKSCSYVFGNPPFVGAKYQSDHQRQQVRQIARLPGSGGTLDYVTAWFIKAGQYLEHSHAKIAFVATNSITQGEQVAQLWPILFERCHLEIDFAHRTFAWGSDARGKAHVHVVIVGLAKAAELSPLKRLFSYRDINGDPDVTEHEWITPYLFDAGSLSNKHLVIKERSTPLGPVSEMIIGSKPIDGGYYIFNEETRKEFLANEPAARSYLRPYVGSEEFINGGKRWIIAPQKIEPQTLRTLPELQKRIKQVAAYRRGDIPASKKAGGEITPRGPGTVKLAATPTLYHVTVIPDSQFLVVPETSSERREYIPIGWMKSPTIPSNLVRVLENVELWQFGVLTSHMHMAWLRYIGGRLKSDYRYSIGLVYNTFPWPEPKPAQRERVSRLAGAVLDARKLFKEATFADLYDRDLMPPELRKAHHALDLAVDKLYRTGAFSGDRDRVEHLVGLYEKQVAPLTATSSGRKGKPKSI